MSEKRRNFAGGTTDNNMDQKRLLAFTIAVISEFAVAYGINSQQAFRYLDKYKGLDFVEEFYDVEHTLSFADVVEDVAKVCRRNGGGIV